MVMNVRQPGFQLLSLSPAELRKNNTPTFDHTPCLLPDQLKIYLDIYLPLLAISILLLFVFNFKTGTSRKSHRKTRSDATQVPFVTNRDDADIEEARMSPYYRENSSTSSLTSQISTLHQNKGISRSSSRTPGWFVLQGRRRQSNVDYPSTYGCLRRIKDRIFFFLPSRTRSNPHRRSWLGAVMRDIRDIAIFPLGAFVLITWWVVS